MRRCGRKKGEKDNGAKRVHEIKWIIKEGYNDIGHRTNIKLTSAVRLNLGNSSHYSWFMQKENWEEDKNFHYCRKNKEYSDFLRCSLDYLEKQNKYKGDFKNYSKS